MWPQARCTNAWENEQSVHDTVWKESKTRKELNTYNANNENPQSVYSADIP